MSRDPDHKPKATPQEIMQARPRALGFASEESKGEPCVHCGRPIQLWSSGAEYGFCQDCIND